MKTTTRGALNIIAAIHDSKIFAEHFSKTPESWTTWEVFLCALFALPMTPEQLVIYQQCTGRSTPPTSPLYEAWLICGRRSGKSFMLSLIAVFLACFFDWRPFLGPGEVGTIMIVAADRRQARVIMRYVVGLLEASPMLKRQIQNVTRETITLKNNIVIEIHTASFKTTRGYSIIAALLDEIAFWPVDEHSAQPDVEVINAIKPGMATIPEAMLLCASSPHARRGALWDAHRKHYGKDEDPVLVWQAATRTMNPAVPEAYIAQHMADDPARAAAEYLAQFRSDLEAFVLREAVEACISVGIRERAPLHDLYYAGYADPSGGSGDSFTLAIGHNDALHKF
jgi:Terminase large subunit, T4likevirus-type, N-terminal